MASGSRPTPMQFDRSVSSSLLHLDRTNGLRIVLVTKIIIFRTQFPRAAM
jgi:hypothetical protein